MKKSLGKFLILINFLLLMTTCSMQKEVALTNRTLAQKDYRLPTEIESLKKVGDMNHYYASAPLYYSWIGEYQKSLELLSLKKRPYPSLSNEQVEQSKHFKQYNALDYIIQKSKSEKLIIINEDHTLPQSRVFAIALLQELYDNGFRILALESLNQLDTLIQQRGYPVYNSGFYTVEPQFGNLIREASKIGFKLFAYDYGTNQNPAEREVNQARNIEKIINNYPEDKILIYCGVSHAYEKESYGFKPMAYQVKKHTGINPLTINQSVVINNFLKKESNPFFNLPIVNTPSIFLNSNNEMFFDPFWDEKYDIEVIHPAAEYKKGRPTWLTFQNSKSWINVPKNKININYPVLIQAFLLNDSEDAIPVDIITLSNKKDTKKLCLLKGEYRLEVLNQSGEFQSIIIETKI